MKILFLHLTQGLVDRGMERVVDLYCSELSNRHHVTVFQAGQLSSHKPYDTVRIMPLSHAPQIAPYNLFEKLLFRLEADPNSIAVRRFTTVAIKHIKKLNPDIIIACNGAPQLKILHRASLGSKLVVFGAAGLGHHDIKTLLARPDLYIALTNYSRQWATAYRRQPTKIIVIPNPVALSRPTKIMTPLTLPKPIVLTVGALTAYKHVTEVVKALSNLALSHLIIGDGEDASTLQSILQNRAHDFLWIKAVDPAILPSYYRQAQAFCFTPESREAFGNVYLEAMAAGLPIVATDDPVRREIIGSSGYFVDPTKADSIRQAVIAALEHGPVDYREQLKQYNVKTVTKQLEKALYEILAN